MSRLIVATVSLLLALTGQGVHAEPQSLTYERAASATATAFEIRLASIVASPSMTRANWHPLSKNTSVVFVAESPLVQDNGILGTAVTETCANDYDQGHYGVLVFLRPDAASNLQAFTAAHVGDLIAMLVNNQLVSVAKVREEVRSSSVRLCQLFASEAEAKSFAKALAGQ